jgi:hypothetical protein
MIFFSQGRNVGIEAMIILCYSFPGQPMGRRHLCAAAAITLLALNPLAAEEGSETPATATAERHTLAVSASFSTELGIGRLLGLSLGGTVRFYWRALPPLCLELAVSARTLIGFQFSCQAAANIPLLSAGSWSLDVGAGLGVAYEDKLVTYTQNDPVPTNGIYGPYWSVYGLISIAPLHLAFPRADLSLLRLGLGADCGAWLVSPFFTLDVLEVIIHL